MKHRMQEHYDYMHREQVVVSLFLFLLLSISALKFPVIADNCSLVFVLGMISFFR